MADTGQRNTRLPRNFHNTFLPERRYIHSMLQFASNGKSGDSQSIALATGIPTGSSSGKVIPILDYCRGMGLISLPKTSMRSAIKEPQLTPFGRTVFLQDPFMKEEVTQWLAHLNLCGPLSGADIWHQLFFRGTQALGSSFQRSQLEDYLKGIYGTQKGNLIGPLVRMYNDPASFDLCGVLREEKSVIHRETPPIRDEYSWGYGAWILSTIKQFFPQATEIPITELDRAAGWKTIPGWGIDEAQQVLCLLERKGILAVDRHMNPWLLRLTGNSANLWAKVYDDLI